MWGGLESERQRMKKYTINNIKKAYSMFRDKELVVSCWSGQDKCSLGHACFGDAVFNLEDGIAAHVHINKYRHINCNTPSGFYVRAIG